MSSVQQSEEIALLMLPRLSQALGLNFFTESMCYKLGTWCLKDMGIYHAQEMFISVEFHYGKCRIWCIWNLTHAKDEKSGYISLCCFDFDYKKKKKSLGSPPVLWKCNAKSLECPLECFVCMRLSVLIMQTCLY